MKISRLHISVFLGVAVLAWSVVLLAQGSHLAWEHLRPFGAVVGVLVAFGLALERVLWHQPWLHGWFMKRPDLRGTWHVKLESDWVDSRTQKRGPPIECFMGVVQSMSHLQMHLMTSESESWIIAETLYPSPSGIGYQIAGVYTNKPKALLRGDRSEVHLGGLILDTHGPPNRPQSLTGEYWTDRKTKGHITLTSRIQTVCSRFEDAEQSFGDTGEIGAPGGANAASAGEAGGVQADRKRPQSDLCCGQA